MEIKSLNSGTVFTGNLKLIHDNQSEWITMGYGGISTGTTHSLRFGVNDSEKMRIDNNGNVGIGTTSPSAYLHVRSTDNVSNYAVPQLLITTDPGSNYNQWASLELRGSYICNTVPYGVGIRTSYGHDSSY